MKLGRVSPRSLASRFESGSSIRNTAGLRTMARARATRCAWPPDSAPGLRDSSSLSPRSARPGGEAALPGADAAGLQRELDVRLHGLVRVQRVALEDHCDVALRAPRRSRAVHRSRSHRRSGPLPAIIASSVDLPHPDGEEDHELAIADVEDDVVDRRDLSEAFGHVADPHDFDWTTGQPPPTCASACSPMSFLALARRRAGALAGRRPDLSRPAHRTHRRAPAVGTPVDRIAQDLADVEIALERLDEGTYWTCEVTGEEPLPDDLLAADPVARRRPSPAGSAPTGLGLAQGLANVPSAGAGPRYGDPAAICSRGGRRRRRRRSPPAPASPARRVSGGSAPGGAPTGPRTGCGASVRPRSVAPSSMPAS